MNNILSLKTVGLSYASTNLSFAFALYFNISMFLLYHNPPLFSITRRTCPNVFLFGVQIPVDACPLFGSKRRSFLFVIDSGIAISFAISEFHSFNCLCNFKRTFLFGTHRAAGTSLLPKAKTSRHRFYFVRLSVCHNIISLFRFLGDILHKTRLYVVNMLH